MRSVGKLIGLFFETAKLRLAQDMAYRVNYLIGLVISLVSSLVSPLLQYLLFSQTRGIPGWSLQQIVLFQGVLLISWGLRSTVFGEVFFYLLGLVRRGNFDRLLLKPYPAIGTILASGFSGRNLGTILAGIIVTVVGAVQLRLEVSLLTIGLALALLIFGLFFYMSFQVLYSAAVVVLVNLGRLYDIVWTLSKFGDYPLQVYGPVVRTVFLTFVPMALWINLPAEALLGRADFFIPIAMLGSIVFFCLSLLAWRAALRKYTSAGG